MIGALLAGTASADDDKCRNGVCPINYEPRIEQIAEPEKNESEKYAILVNSDYAQRHKYNLENAYKTLWEVGFNDGNIHVLSHDGPDSVVCEEGKYAINGLATKDNFNAVVDHVSEMADDNDLVLIYATGHGSKRDGESWLQLSNKGRISAEQFREEIEKIDSGVTAVVMDQCYSGGFPEELEKSNSNIVAMSNTDSNHKTFCKYFADAFWGGLTDSKTDINGDGNISFGEAYAKAILEHKRKMREQGREHQTNGRFICTNGLEDEILCDY
jgi:hypothetical protein